jgi:DnaJ-class molecular chaperone
MKLFYAALLILAPLLVSGAPEKQPKKPLKNSDIGYFVVKKEAETALLSEKAFIPSSYILPVYSESKENFVFLYQSKKGSMLLKIPKRRRYVLQMAWCSDKKNIRFQGGMQVNTLPFKLELDEELPVISQDNDSAIVWIKRKDFVIPVKIKKNEENFNFFKLSKFQRFAKEVEAKGLRLYNGEFIPEKEVTLLQQKAADAKHKLELKRREFLKAAEKGYVILEDGTVWTGSIKGRRDQMLLFSSNGTEKWIKAEDSIDLPAEQICGRAILYNEGKRLDSISNFFNENKFGKLIKVMDNCDYKLKEITSLTEIDSRKLAKIKLKIKNLRNKVDKALKEQKKSIYQYHVFPEKELSYHLKQGHILFKNKIWLNKNQLCGNCNGKGEIICEKCNGKGKVEHECEHCDGKGCFVCDICKGEGSKKCNACEGKGEFAVQCHKCEGNGLIWKRIKVLKGGGGGSKIVINGKVYSTPSSPAFYEYQDIEVQCPDCQGNGIVFIKCRRCNGRGWLKCPKTIKCSVCKGDGKIAKKCKDCKGKGKVSCPKCNGKGFIGEPQVLPEEKSPVIIKNVQ